MAKDIEPTKKTLKMHLVDAGIFYLFLCNLLATFYLILVTVPSAPFWATYPVAFGTAITALVAWFKN